MTLREKLAALKQAQEEIPHAHFTSIDVSSTGEPLPCGSQFFLNFNGHYTIGFDRDALILFRDNVVEGVGKALAARAASSTSQDDATCIYCRGEVTAENGFATVIGSMHFDCEKEG